MTKYQAIADKLCTGNVKLSNDTSKLLGLMAKFNALNEEMVLFLGEANFCTTDDQGDYQNDYEDFYIRVENLLLKAIEHNLRPVGDVEFNGEI